MRVKPGTEAAAAAAGAGYYIKILYLAPVTTVELLDTMELYEMGLL